MSLVTWTHALHNKRGSEGNFLFSETESRSALVLDRAACSKVKLSFQYVCIQSVLVVIDSQRLGGDTQVGRRRFF